MKIRNPTFNFVTCALMASALTPMAFAQAGDAAKSELARGKYLVGFGGCSDCHTPKSMTANGPVPDNTRLLSGHPASSPIPPIPAGVLGPAPTQWAAMTNSDLTAWAGPWGVSFAANLTPDEATGLGNWTADQFIKTMRTGKHLGVGRSVLPPMPFYDVAVLTDRDMKAMFAYLKSLKPLANAVPQPISPK